MVCREEVLLMVCPMDFVKGFYQMVCREGDLLMVYPMDFVKGFYQKVCREEVLLMVCPMAFVKMVLSKGLQRKISVGFVSPSTGLLYRTYTPDLYTDN